MHKKGGQKPNLILPKNTLYVAYDESNHGKFPEIDVVTLSGLEKYIKKGTFPKQRKKLPSLRTGPYKDYFFLLASEVDCKRIPPKELLGVTIVSLIEESIGLPNLEFLELFVDGEHRLPYRKYVKDIISERCFFPRKNINLNYGANFDRQYPLVNWADNLAHYLFRKCSPEKLSRNPKRRNFIK